MTKTVKPAKPSARVSGAKHAPRAAVSHAVRSNTRGRTAQAEQAQHEPQRSFVRKLKLFMVALVALAVVASALVFWQFKQFVSAPISQHSTVLDFEIVAGSSATKVAYQLHEKGYLSAPKWFLWYLNYQDKPGQIKAGEVKIYPYWTVDQLIEQLLNGKVIQYPATLIAGQTIEQTLRTIQALPKIQKQLDLSQPKEVLRRLSIDLNHYERYPYAAIEGWFLPETYYYKAGDSDLDIAMRAHHAMRDVLDQAWQNRQKDLPIKTPYEALILASIVEKETGVARERGEIAGVFVNRIQKNMRLQTDPTVIYGIGQGYDGNIRKVDLQANTPYNTYRIDGLPPTPIALPSKEAIEAVMQPTKTQNLFFVAKGGGEHHFSTTLDEHNNAVNRYILGK
ncbi:endolytic transglycosylase MltG [Thiomicrorhabdus aquaedulcis]|uniref:endolytic transglycosylase MltG n=1 Tax=Thiomicrorhabdus aquaedulcis TaxID=2211106 RepID=UPI001E4759F0|nr:endolytic transglycosylase MltG [Thiomicrorhabdus aquaedulcis]